jgi:hypothetical protein
VRDGGVLDPEMVSRAVRNFHEGGTANDRVDVQKIWYLLAFEMWRSRWMKPQERTQGVEHARALCN